MQPGRSPRSPNWLAVAAALLVLIGLSWHFVQISLITQPEKGYTDLATFYWAAQAMALRVSPYDTASLQAMAPTQVFPLFYPPPVLLFFSELRHLSFPQAVTLIYWANHLLFAFLLVLLPLGFLGLSPARNTFWWALVTFYLLVFFPVRSTIDLGQVNLLLALLLTLFWISWRDGHTLLSGLFLSLSILLKSYPVLLLPFLYLGGRRREIGWTLAFLATMTWLSWGILPPGTWESWYQQVFTQAGYGKALGTTIHPAAIWNQSLNGVTARWFLKSPWSTLWVLSPALAKALPMLGAVLLTLISLQAFRTSTRRESGADADHALRIALPLLYLIAPLSWDHHLVYLLPAILASIGTWRGSPPQRAGHALVLVAIGFVLAWEDGVPLRFFGVLGLWLHAIFLCYPHQVELLSTLNPPESVTRPEDA